MINHIEIERTANGFMLFTNSEIRDYGRMRSSEDTFVFNRVEDLANKVKELFSPEESKASE